MVSGNAAIALPRHAWQGASGKGKNKAIIRDIRPNGKNGNEIGISAAVSEKRGAPALAGKDREWIPASTEGRERIEKEMGEALERISRNAARINASAPPRDIIAMALAGSGHSC